MNRLDDQSRIPVLDIREGDVSVLLGAPVSGLVFGSLTGVDLLAIALAIVGVAVGVGVVYAAPSHLTATTWLAAVFRHLFRRPAVTYSSRPGEDRPPSDGASDGPRADARYVPLGVDECTQELTHVKRAWQGACAIERTDGTMEAFIELEPANMDFAMSDDWMAVQSAAAEFANANLGFPLTLHTTTQSFPADRLVEQLDGRLFDPDVKANPTFEELIREYRQERPTALDDTRKHRFFVGVEADPIEVYQRYDAEPTPSERLTEFPVIGFLFTPFVTRREELDSDEARRRLFETLDERVRTVRTEFVDEISGWSSRRLETIDLFLLVTEFWNGEELPAENAGRLLRAREALGRQPRRASE